MKPRTCLPVTIASGLLAVTLLLAPHTLRAQGAPAAITADESGNGTLVTNGGPFNLPGVLAPDPGPGGQSSALTYNLLGPPSLVSGDLHIFDIGSNVFTDLIRFNPSGAGGNGAYSASFVFYSPIGGGLLADTGLPSGAYTNIVNLIETAAGDIFYTPTSGQPGFITGFNTSYHFISGLDAVPEGGATLLLLGFGFAGLLTARRFIRPRVRITTR